MLDIKTEYVYRAFGLNVLSDIPLPELRPITNQVTHIDIDIKLYDISQQWNEMIQNQQINMVVKENFYMFQLKDIAIFCIQDGNKILVSPNGDANFDKIRLFILGTCMGALLMQRKVLTLHGSSIVIDGKAYAFVGDRGAGKSTLAAAFIRKGYALLTDDVIAIDMKREPVVIPSYPQQKLWQESIEAFGEDAKKFKPLYDRETKYSVPVQKEYYSSPIQLGGVFELIKAENNHIAVHPISGLEQLRTLYIHTFRQYLLKGFGLLEWHFKTISNLLKVIKLYQLQRPTSVFTAEELVTSVLETINKGETTHDRNQEDFIGQ